MLPNRQLRGYILHGVPASPDAIECLECGRLSRNRDDVEGRYCVGCNASFHGTPAGTVQMKLLGGPQPFSFEFEAPTLAAGMCQYHDLGNGRQARCFEYELIYYTGQAVGDVRAWYLCMDEWNVDVRNVRGRWAFRY